MITTSAEEKKNKRDKAESREQQKKNNVRTEEYGERLYCTHSFQHSTRQSLDRYLYLIFGWLNPS